MIERKICHLSRTQHNELCQLFDKEALSNLAVSKCQSYKESNHRHILVMSVIITWGGPTTRTRWYLVTVEMYCFTYSDFFLSFFGPTSWLVELLLLKDNHFFSTTIIQKPMMI